MDEEDTRVRIPVCAHLFAFLAESYSREVGGTSGTALMDVWDTEVEELVWTGFNISPTALTWLHTHNNSPHPYGITLYFCVPQMISTAPIPFPDNHPSVSPYMPIHYHIDGIHRIPCFLLRRVRPRPFGPACPGVPRPMILYQPTQSLSFCFPSLCNCMDTNFQVARSLAAVYTTDGPWAILSVWPQPQFFPGYAQKMPKNPSYLTLH